MMDSHFDLTTLHLMASSLNQVPGDFDHNLRNIVNAIVRASRLGATLLALPELAIPGYGLDDQVLDPQVARTSAEILFDRILPMTTNMLLIVGLPVIVRRAQYNGAAVCFNGRLLGISLKEQLAQDGPLYEARHFKPWKGGDDTWTFRGVSYPVGKLLYDIHGVKFGCEICQDAWVGERPGLALVQAGAQVIVNPSCSPYQPKKRAVRLGLMTDFTRMGACVYVYAGQTGITNGTVPCDTFAAIVGGGKVLAGPPDMYFGEFADVHARINLEDLASGALADGSFQPKRQPILEVVVDLKKEALWLTPQASDEIPLTTMAPWRGASPKETEHLIEQFHMLAMAMFWYLVRSKQQGWMLPLSGGRDSTLVLIALSRGLDLALNELGWADLTHTLHHIRGISNIAENDLPALKRRLLKTCYIIGQASSAATELAAEEVARELGSEHQLFDSRLAFDASLGTLNTSQETPFSWERPADVVPLENLTTTVRFAIARFLANIDGRILLCTANLTEMAVGYYTLGADANAGYAPLTSINKTTVLAMLDLLQAGWTGFEPVQSIGQVLSAGAATAELQPGKVQTDEGFMGPFSVVDLAIDLLLGRHWPAKRAFAELREVFPDYDTWQLYDWFARLCSRWTSSQWKRYQTTPGPRLSAMDLMSQVSTRTPIIGSGYTRDLKLLRKQLESEIGPRTRIH